MRKDFEILFRYGLVLLSSINGLWIFYFIFTPLTIFLSYLFFKLFFDVSLSSNNILLNNLAITLIPACIAGSAYFLLFFLNMSLPKINFQKRFLMVLFSFSLFLIINLFRIFFLVVIYKTNLSLFSAIHFILWFLVSVIFIILIWFLEVKLFNINEIPVYSDFHFLIRRFRRNTNWFSRIK